MKLPSLQKRTTTSFRASCLLRRRRQWHPTPVLLPGNSHGRRSLVGYSRWGREESDTTERLHFHFSLSCIGEGNGNPLQYSCLENPRDRGAWWAAVYGVAQSRTRLRRFSSSLLRRPTLLLFTMVCSWILSGVKPRTHTWWPSLSPSWELGHDHSLTPYFLSCNKSSHESCGLLSLWQWEVYVRIQKLGNQLRLDTLLPPPRISYFLLNFNSLASSVMHQRGLLPASNYYIFWNFLRSLTSHWQLETGHGGIIYIMATCSGYKSDLLHRELAVHLFTRTPWDSKHQEVVLLLHPSTPRVLTIAGSSTDQP